MEGLFQRAFIECPQCGGPTDGVDPIVCADCGRLELGKLKLDQLISDEPPEGVRLGSSELVLDKTGISPYRGCDGEHLPRLELLIERPSTASSGIYFAFGSALLLFAFLGAITIVLGPLLFIASIACFVAGSRLHGKPVQVIVTAQEVLWGQPDQPKQEWKRIAVEHIECVFLRSMFSCADEKNRRYELKIAARHRADHTLLTQLDGLAPAAWIMNAIEEAVAASPSAALYE